MPIFDHFLGNAMIRPKISIVIPTRDRADTLFHCLSTCINQDFESVEFVVSANACTDETQQIAASFNDPRIRFVETPQRVDMRDNWEFALGHAQGQYIGFLGDDDGIVPGGLSIAWAALEEYDFPPSLKSSFVVYVWPSAVESMGAVGWYPGALAGTIEKNARIVNNDELLERYANFDISYGELPGLYYGLVDREVLEQIRRGGRVFNSKNPDVYSAVAIAGISPFHLRLGRAMMIAGLSHHSNGARQLFGQDQKGKGSKNADLFHQENQCSYHSSLVECPSGPVFMAESLMQAKDLGLLQSSIVPNFERMLEMAIAELPRKPEVIQVEIIEALKKMADIHDLNAENIPDNALPAQENVIPAEISLLSSQLNFHLDTKPLKLQSISDAVGFYGIFENIATKVILEFEKTRNELVASVARESAAQKELSEALSVVRELELIVSLKSKAENEMRIIHGSLTWRLARIFHPFWDKMLRLFRKSQ